MVGMDALALRHVHHLMVADVPILQLRFQTLLKFEQLRHRVLSVNLLEEGSHADGASVDFVPLAARVEVLAANVELQWTEWLPLSDGGNFFVV